MATKKNITYGAAAVDKLSELQLCFHYTLAVIKRTNRNKLQLVYALNATCAMKSAMQICYLTSQSEVLKTTLNKVQINSN
jgi:hypothetical protein